MQSSHLAWFIISALTAAKNQAACITDYIGTHGVADVEISVSSPNALSVTTSYSNTSGATGVLLLLQYITSNGSLDLSKSHPIVLDKSSSSNHTINDLFSGHYRVLAYDVEQDQKLAVGIGYPAAVTDQIFINGSNGGMPLYAYKPSLMLFFHTCL